MVAPGKSNAQMMGCIKINKIKVEIDDPRKIIFILLIGSIDKTMNYGPSWI